jgi:two-component system response regulator AtoC
MKLLCSYHWPGNVRELENAIERGVVISDLGELGVAALPERISGTGGSAGGVLLPSDTLSIRETGEAMERELIRRALEKTGGNRTHAAKLLEISLRSLLYKIKEYGLE